MTVAHITIVWHDRDGTRTTHNFDTAVEAEPWLRDVLAEHCPAAELEAAGYGTDGLGMLHNYCDEGYDDIGTLEVFVDGMGVDAHALLE